MKVRNWILNALPDEEFTRLAPSLERVDLDLREILFDYDQPIEHIYFPEDCVASIVSVMVNGAAVETATVGREGMIGLPVFLGADRTQSQSFCQIPGSAFRMEAGTFRAAIGNGGHLTAMLNRYTQALFTQLAQSAACNRLHTTRERCARWLLMCHDRMGQDHFSLTHQFLSQMLGVRRATVTDTAASLQREGLIQYSYGHITIVDRPGLEAASCECYVIIQREFERLLANREIPAPFPSHFSENGKTTVGGGDRQEEGDSSES